MMMYLRISIIAALLLWTSAVSAQSGNFTYQGRLENNGVPFNGVANLEFRFFDQLEGGTSLGITTTAENWPVNDGVFKIPLSMGSGLNQSNGRDRFLQIAVNGVILTPRQAVTPTPLAFRALSVAEGAPGASPFTRNPSNGNIEYRFGDQVFRFQPDTDPDTMFSAGESPRVTLGHANNRAERFGDTVSGGGVSTLPNVASGSMSTVGGGWGNTAGGFGATVGGGTGNNASGSGGTVGGGAGNTASAGSSTISGGSNNTASGLDSTVSGGRNNCSGGRYSWAGGQRAKVRPRTGLSAEQLGEGCDGVDAVFGGDVSTFVWADSLDADFVSSGQDQFLVRATGGMGINTNDPETQLHIVGPSPGNDPFGQMRLEGSETSGAAGTGAGVSFLGHDGGIRRIWGYIQAVKENSTVGNTRSRMSFHVRGASGLPAERFRIDSNGATFNTSGTWSTLSDGRLKSDIGEIPDALDRLTRLRGVHFRYTDPEQAMGAGGPRIGFLAEEVEQVFPEWVGYNEDGYRFLSLTGFEAVVVEALRTLQERNAAAIEIRDRQIASLEAGLAEMAAGHHDLRQAIEHQEIHSAQMQELAERNAALENRLAILEEMMLVGRRLAENP